MTVHHVLDAILLLLALICFAAAMLAARSASPRVTAPLWIAAGLFLWCLTVFLATLGVH